MAKLFELTYSENGSERRRAILDSNVIYSALHNPSGACGRIVILGTEGSVELYSIDVAREELQTNLERKMGIMRNQVESILQSLPIRWMPREAYGEELGRAVLAMGNKPDAAFLAAALATGIPLVTGDKDFQSRKVRRLIRTYRPSVFESIARK